MFAPFGVVCALMLWLLTLGNTRFGPSNNAAFVVSALVIVAGLVIGVAGLVTAHRVPWPLRVVIGLLYVPTALVSALMAGF